MKTLLELSGSADQPCQVVLYDACAAATAVITLADFAESVGCFTAMLHVSGTPTRQVDHMYRGCVYAQGCQALQRYAQNNHL
jgi:hypothetical protein